MVKKKKDILTKAVRDGMLLKLSKHMAKDRQERLNRVMEIVGYDYGRTVLTSENGDKTEHLTDKGVLLVVDKNNTIITMYLATMSKACAMHAARGLAAHVPTRLADIIGDNNRRYASLCEEESE